MFLFLLFWFFFATLVSIWGSKRGHSAIASFLFALMFSPLLAFIVLWFWKGDKIKKCPKCAEQVKFEAVKCKHCGHDFSILTASEAEKLRIKEIEEKSSKLF